MAVLRALTRRLSTRRAELKTLLARRFGPSRSREERLHARIRARVKALGATYEDGNSNLVGYTYHPIFFPGFDSVPAHRAACDARLDAIIGDLQPRAGDWILDVGANVGYFSFGLAERGAFVEAYEAESDTFEIGAALAQLHDANVIYVNRSVSARALPLLRPRYRAVLLLSVFHWIVKQEGESQALAVLRDLLRRSERLYFEVPCDSGDALYRHAWFSSPENVQAFFARELPSFEATRLGEDGDWAGRVLWRIRSREDGRA